ncbi:MAG: UDP-N-acetylmuramoyl-tripeptide--D-alanyl-D-alanine ligase, partial [Proteobacteria bacterium]|nr:UDP-N-acetylmuramoyl-tripeptide--D-alanyl-D-alanine ligase [Pseudomonadota bacterium]
GQVHDKGAAAAVVATLSDDDIAQITVADTRLALGELGAAWRRRLSTVVVGITGSNGKTTLKELTAACLAQTASTFATQGNLNNDIGMPLMLTRIDATHRYAVLEMGANHAGEIAYLTSLARPDVVAITNAAASHLEGFGTVEGVAQAKGEILSDDQRPDVAILNVDDDYFEYWSSLAADINVVSFGLDDAADVRAERIIDDAAPTRFKLQLPDDAVEITLALVGTHNVRNACAAAAIAHSLGVNAVQIKAALESVQPVAGRLQPLAGVNGATLYDDSYNANPSSVAAAAEFLAGLAGDNWLVLGDMGELGDAAAQLHCEVGDFARRAGVARLFAVGELSRNTVDGFGDGAVWLPSIEVLVDTLRAEISDDVNVLVKGSRIMRMERVVTALAASQTMRREA